MTTLVEAREQEEELNSYLKKQYPAIAEKYPEGVSGNEVWLLDIAIRAFRAGFEAGVKSSREPKEK